MLCQLLQSIAVKHKASIANHNTDLKACAYLLERVAKQNRCDEQEAQTVPPDRVNISSRTAECLARFTHNRFVSVKNPEFELLPPFGPVFGA